VAKLDSCFLPSLPINIFTNPYCQTTPSGCSVITPVQASPSWCVFHSCIQVRAGVDPLPVKLRDTHRQTLTPHTHRAPQKSTQPFKGLPQSSPDPTTLVSPPGFPQLTVIMAIKTSSLPLVNLPPSPTEQCSQCYHQDTSGICQSFNICKLSEEEAPNQHQLNRPLLVPIPSDSVISRSNSAADLSKLPTTAKMIDRRASVERLPAEIFGMFCRGGVFLTLRY